LLKCLDAGAKVKVIEKFMENYPFIKQDIKNIIGKVFLIYEQFKTATNNTNSDVRRIAKMSRRRHKGQGNGKNSCNIIPS